ncbi:hypothetical protein BGZ90_007680 [Linnemannia elongata]|nr:hypothetical protein BGZ90_007680 [Linnemannia elongata]
MSSSHNNPHPTSPTTLDPNATLVGPQQEDNLDTPAQNNTQNSTPTPVSQHIDPILACIEKRYLKTCEELDMLDNVPADVTLPGPPRQVRYTYLQEQERALREAILRLRPPPMDPHMHIYQEALATFATALQALLTPLSRR